ncbi:MAG TPA: MerC domain-containing protein [Bryobacteraceae bacterium]
MKTKLDSPLIDRIAMFVAAACGLHCICFPILLAITTASSFVHLLSEPVEKGFLASAFVLGIANLSGSWWRSHHRPECLVLFAVGMALIVLHEYIPGAIISASVSVAGGALIGAAHFRNLQLLRKCGCCQPASPSCERGSTPE